MEVDGVQDDNVTQIQDVTQSHEALKTYYLRKWLLSIKTGSFISIMVPFAPSRCMLAILSTEVRNVVAEYLPLRWPSLQNVVCKFTHLYYRQVCLIYTLSLVITEIEIHSE